MKKVEMVRCYVTSPGEKNPEATVRFVPSDIFRLWRYLMEDVKGFSVVDAATSFWVDEDMYSRERGVYGEHQIESVIEVSFVYCRDSEVGRPVIRYFPHDQLETILGYFMKNFSEDYVKGGLQKVTGYFVRKKTS
jgi:hypothetical protein